MNQTAPRHEIQIITSSLADLKALLPDAGNLDAGCLIKLDENISLEIGDVSKSSGFDVASLIVTGIVTVATSTSSALLIEWAKSKLFKVGASKSGNITIIINGTEVKIDTSAGQK